jgi:DNA-directed RNA polymerase subunit RPC12/RpoP|tara:strand:- start:41 stop:199 length:159 start_codon:yes stop_codon:yes gene_type:complete
VSEICPYCGSKRLKKHNGEYKCKKCRAESSVVDEFIEDYIVAQAEKEKRNPE